MDNKKSNNPQTNLDQDIDVQFVYTDDDDEYEEEEDNERPRVNQNIIDDQSVDPFLPPSDAQFDESNSNINNSNDSDQISPLNSDLLFQSSAISSGDISLKPTSDDSESLSQIQLNSFINDSSFARNNDSIEKYHKMQAAKREPKYPTPDISVDTYFRDLIGRDINGPNLPSNEEIYAFIEPYSFEEYAKENFRKNHSLVPETVEQLTTFSSKPLTKPLLKKIDKSKKTICQKLSTSILKYIKIIDSSAKNSTKDEAAKNKHDNLLMMIIKLIKDDDELVDECLMQLMKTMRRTPDKHSLLLAWKIFITVVYIYYIKDDEILNVVRWFLIHKMDSDGKEKSAAYYSFICLHDRSVIGRNHKETRKSLVVQIPYCAFCGHQMYMCSLYEQMWNQKRKYPKLPIPLMLYLVVKALIKNGVFITPNPFPIMYTSMSKSSFKTSSAATTESNASVKNDKTKSTDTTAAASHASNDDDSRTKKTRFFEVSSKKMKVLYRWINELPFDSNALKDGEVYDLVSLLLEWLANLVDPIVPKEMINEFGQVFGAQPDESSPSKYNEFIQKLPLLHLNTLKYLTGFLREVAKNEKLTFQSYQKIAENTGCFFVDTKFATIDPFTMKKIYDISPRFVVFCLENLDVSAVYPLNPAYEVVVDN